MKACLAVVFSLICSISAEARQSDWTVDLGGNDSPVTQVVCRDARSFRDGGIKITIQSGGFVGITTALVSEVTLMGSQALETLPVDRVEDPTGHPGLIAYHGDGFKLVINKNLGERSKFPAKLKARLNGETSTIELICRVNE